MCTVDCPHCKKRFKNNQGLGVHKLPCTKTKGHVPPQLTDVHDTGVSEKRQDSLIDDVVKSTVNYLLSGSMTISEKRQETLIDDVVKSTVNYLLSGSMTIAHPTIAHTTITNNDNFALFP